MTAFACCAHSQSLVHPVIGSLCADCGLLLASEVVVDGSRQTPRVTSKKKVRSRLLVGGKAKSAATGGGGGFLSATFESSGPSSSASASPPPLTSSDAELLSKGNPLLWQSLRESVVSDLRLLGVPSNMRAHKRLALAFACFFTRSVARGLERGRVEKRGLEEWRQSLHLSLASIEEALDVLDYCPDVPSLSPDDFARYEIAVVYRSLGFRPPADDALVRKLLSLVFRLGPRFDAQPVKAAVLVFLRRAYAAAPDLRTASTLEGGDGRLRAVTEPVRVLAQLLENALDALGVATPHDFVRLLGALPENGVPLFQALSRCSPRDDDDDDA